jgi:hypothetical protein
MTRSAGANGQEIPMRRPIVPLVAAIGLAALLVPLVAAPASAHEDRKVGKLDLVVGFGDEPAYAGDKNSVQLLLSDGAGKPVTDLGDAFKVEVSTDSAPGQKLDLAMEPFFEIGEFGTPGDYRAFFIPTSPGKYTFHLTGSYKGQKVDQRFTSSKTGFSEVVDPASAKFPVKDPTTGQLAQRLDREVPRLDAALAASQAAERKARDDASSARALAIVGIAVGLLGLVAAGIALARRSSAAGAAPRSRVPAGKA